MSMIEVVAALWRRLAAQAASAGVALRLRPPASEAAIRAAEHAIGLGFPDGFRASLRVHDGQEPGDDDLACAAWLPGQAPLASVDRIVARWRVECATHAAHHADEAAIEIADGRLLHYLWHPRRIPIAGNAWFDQDNTYLDFVPGPRGVAGQLAIFGKGTSGAVQAPSFEVALTLFVEALERGTWRYEPTGEAVARARRSPAWGRFVDKALAAPARARRR